MAVMLLQGRKHRWGTQARGILTVLAVASPLLGCGLPPELRPGTLFREISGANWQSRIQPPGVDLPSGHLGQIPPRPSRPDPATRMSLDNALAQDRALSREPLAERRDAAIFTSASPGATPGAPSIPAAPPPRPNLAAAPAIPWTGPALLAPGAVAPEPGDVPALPTPDLLGPPGTPPPPPRLN
jgi:hypothetical protein